MTKRIIRAAFLMVVFIAVVIPCYFYLAAENCDGVCTNPEEPCCCEKKDGYYVDVYSCGCAGGKLQWHQCHYMPAP